MMTAMPAATPHEPFEEHRKFLWGLCYRLTGIAADADDIVQQTFERALTRPPRDTGLPWRPWLVRVAVNQAKDVLRERKRRGYVGPWIPSPVETGDAAAPEPADDRLNPEGRYDLLESTTFAFLLALENLTPKQRASLVLRDVFDYSVRETALALALSEADVRTTHHRARAAMSAYDRARCIPTVRLQARTRHALERLAGAIASQDRAAVEASLAGSAQDFADGGGEFNAALKPIRGVEKIARVLQKLALKLPVTSAEVRLVNGLPALVATCSPGRKKDPPRFVLAIDLDAAGKVINVYNVVASRKLTAISFPEAD